MMGIIGGGNMGEAIIAGVIEKGIMKPEEILVSDIKEERLSYLKEEYGVGVTKSNKEVVSASTLILLAVKPQDMRKVVLEFKDTSWKEKLFVSIAAGLKISFFKNLLGPHLKIVRVMPNLCIKVKKGITAISPSPEVKREELEKSKDNLFFPGEGAGDRGRFNGWHYCFFRLGAFSVVPPGEVTLNLHFIGSSSFFKSSIDPSRSCLERARELSQLLES